MSDLFLPQYATVKTKQQPRIYKVGGESYQRVSTALGVINKPAIGPWMVKMATNTMHDVLMQEDVQAEIALAAENPKNYEAFVERLFQRVKDAPNEERDARADRGTGIHEEVATWLGRDPDEIDYDDLTGPASHAIQFIKDWDITVLGREVVVWDDELKVAGTLDGVGTLPDGSVILWDWKTGSGPYWEMALQLGAYWSMYGNLTGTVVDRLGIVKLTEDDYFFHEVVDPASAWEAYKDAVSLHRAGKVDRFKEIDIFDLG